MKKLVDIKELKANHSSEYNTVYQEYCTAQWDFPLEESVYVDGLNEDNKWLDVDNIYYSVSYSQGDYAYFTGRVDLTKFLDEFDTEGEYFVLREAMKLKDAGEKLDICQNRRWGESAHFENIKWIGLSNWDYEGGVVKTYGGYNSILVGMNYGEYYNLCRELSGDLEKWVKGKCEGLFTKLYDDIRSEIDYMMSEEAFEEWAESMDEKFEVEIDDEGNTEEATSECGGAVSSDEAGRLAA